MENSWTGMNCDWLKQLLDYSCRPLKGMHGENVIEIATPFTFVDGTAIVVYSIDFNGKVMFSDNGNALFHLSTLGLLNRNTRGIKEAVAPFNVQLSDDGDIRTLANKDSAPYIFSQFIAALLQVVNWEREHIDISEETRNLAEEAEIFLRAWKPQHELVKSPKVRGQSNREYHFDFLLDGDYIDVIPANARSTGKIMRKVGDVAASTDMDSSHKTLIIIDDSINPELAEKERNIVGLLSKAILFSKLKERHSSTLN